jgi:hypothetical protein
MQGMEFAYVHSDMCGPTESDRVPMVLPSPWSWHRMTELNEARALTDIKYIWVNHPSFSNSLTMFEGMDIRVLDDGSELYTWIHPNSYINQSAVVARWIDEGDFILVIEIKHNVSKLIVEFSTLGGSVECEAEFSTGRSITYGYLAWHVHRTLMIRDGRSKFLNLKLVQGSSTKSPQDCCWSPRWVNRALKPDRRLVRKQPYHLRKTLNLYFAELPRVVPGMASQ